MRDREIVTYGFSPQADICASDIRHDAEGSVFDVAFSGGEMDGMRMYACPRRGAPTFRTRWLCLLRSWKKWTCHRQPLKALGGFTGVKRRFAKTGESHGITVIDDYAHHPVEIETVLKTCRAVVAEAGGRDRRDASRTIRGSMICSRVLHLFPWGRYSPDRRCVCTERGRRNAD
ncbi:MAG: cyanophycin synthetase [Alphaproteobacteria bacterium]